MLARRPRPHRADEGLRTVVPGVARHRDRAREQPARPDVQHARAGDALPARSAAPLDERERRSRVRGVAVRRVVVDPLRLGREVVLRDAVRRRSRAAVCGRRHRRPDRRRRPDRLVGAARQRHRRHRLVPQARPQPAAHRHVPGGRSVGRGGTHPVRRLGSRTPGPGALGAPTHGAQSPNPAGDVSAAGGVADLLLAG